MNKTFKNLIILSTCLSAMLVFTQCNTLKKMTGKGTGGKEMKIETTAGDIKIVLYNETPLHRDNFVKLCKNKYYDGVIFHRVIKEFMIQTGDPESKNPTPQGRYGNGGPGYTVPAEFVPGLFHKKGAVAAARTGDQVNPEKASSGSQFYIVVGKVFTLDDLKGMEAEKQRTIPGFKFSEEAIKAYTTIGGTPHLDGAYTVFGEVIEGINVVDSIATTPTDRFDRPKDNVVIKRLK